MGLNPSRVVAFFVTPILSAGSLVGCAWLAKHFPGLPPLDPQEVTAFGVAGFTAALAACLKWLHGWSLYERTAKQLQHDAELVAKFDPSAAQAVGKAAEVVAQQGVAKVVAAIVPATPVDHRADGVPPAPEPAPEPAAAPTEPTPAPAPAA
jgi:hypothetical protein